MDFQEMKAYQNSLELVFEIFGIVSDKDDAEKLHWKDSIKRTCVEVSLAVARGGARYPDPSCVEHWKTASLVLPEVGVLLEIGYEHKIISKEQWIDMSRLVDEISRLLSRMIDASDIQ